MIYRRRISESVSRRSVRARCLATGVALGTAVASLSSLAGAQAARFPFPSSNITSGTTTTVLTSHEINDLYNFWKQRFVVPCGNAMRVQYPETNNDTRSEGIGYGMVIAAYMGDKATFDGLNNFYTRFANGRNGTPPGLMIWKTNNCDGTGDTGSAADADVDAAFARIVADKQWPGSGYAAQATTLINAIQAQLFQGGCPGILLAGSTFANCGCTNPSYSTPAYYRAYAQYDNDPFWTQTAVPGTYTYLAAAQFDATGLVPAWSSSGGGGVAGACNPQVSGGGATNQFQADAARTPWRVATDLLWGGGTAPANFLRPMATFISSAPNRIVQIVDNYSLQGTPQTTNGAAGLNAGTLDATGRRSTFTMGGFATAMTGSSQANLDAFTGAWQSMYLPGDSVDGLHAFNTSLALLYGLTVTGFMWNPASATLPTPRTPPAVVDQIIDTRPNLLDNGDFDEGILGWTMENFGAGASEGYAMHKGGEVTLALQEGQPAEPWNLPFYQTVNVRAGQNYLISFKAKASAARQLRVTVAQVLAPFTTYGEIIDRVNAEQLVAGIPGTGVALTTEYQAFETVFKSPGNDPAARFAFQLGQSNAAVTIDDVVFVETTRAPSFRGELGGDPVTGTGGAGGVVTPPGGGAGGAPGTAGTNGTAPIGTVPGETVGGPPGSSGGGQTAAPAVPGTAPGAVAPGTARTDASCLPYKYSAVLKLCYDANTGYVYNDVNARWERPPVTPECAPYVFWPKIGTCYDETSGHYFNPDTRQWVYIGANYTVDTGSESSKCTLVEAPKPSAGAFWALFGLAAGGAAAVTWRRRDTRRRSS